MFKLKFVNHGYSVDVKGSTFEEALAEARRCAFQSIIYDGENAIAFYCPLNGLTFYNKADRRKYDEQAKQAKIQKCIEENGQHEMYHPNYKWYPMNYMQCYHCPYETGR